MGKMMVRNVVMGMLFITVIAPIVLYTDQLGTFQGFSSSSSSSGYVEDVTTIVSKILLLHFHFIQKENKLNRNYPILIFDTNFNGDTGRLNLLPQESDTKFKEPIGLVFSDNETQSLSNSSVSTNLSSTDGRDSKQDWQLGELREHVSARVLFTTNVEDHPQTENPIKKVTDGV